MRNASTPSLIGDVDVLETTSKIWPGVSSGRFGTQILMFPFFEKPWKINGFKLAMCQQIYRNDSALAICTLGWIISHTMHIQKIGRSYRKQLIECVDWSTCRISNSVTPTLTSAGFIYSTVNDATEKSLSSFDSLSTTIKPHDLPDIC